MEQVREALGLGKFILLGHFWGGILCMEYALKYEKDGHLLGLVISNMVDSGKNYQDYLGKIRRETLSEEELAYAEKAEAEEREESGERYRELIDRKLSSAFLCRLNPPPAFLELPDVPAKAVYHHFQGDNEFVITGEVKDWDRSRDTHKISTKTLAIGARYDSMNPARIGHMGRELKNGRSYICPEGRTFAFGMTANTILKR